jgi:hypothetical protein
MARSLRIPGLIDLVRVDARSDIRGLADDSRLDRRFDATGPLINRILVQRIRSVLRIDGVPLPSVAPRQDAKRLRMQEALRSRLDPAGATPLWDDETLAGLADAVRDPDGASALGPATQQAVGRLFVPDYRGTSESWAAANVLDEAVHTRNPLRAIFLQLSGQLRRSRQLLADLVKDDLAGVHATGIAVHNLVRGFERMRELWSDPRWRSRPADAVVEQCLFAPPNVLRQATMPGATIVGEVRPGTLVMLELEAARVRTPGRDVELMTGTWAQCPAVAFVPALLRAVWARAAAAPTTETASRAHPS